MFAISNDNALFVVGDPDAESKTIYNLTIQATDGYNQALKQVFALGQKYKVIQGQKLSWCYCKCSIISGHLVLGVLYQLLMIFLRAFSSFCSI